MKNRPVRQRSRKRIVCQRQRLRQRFRMIRLPVLVSVCW